MSKKKKKNDHKGEHSNSPIALLQMIFVPFLMCSCVFIIGSVIFIHNLDIKNITCVDTDSREQVELHAHITFPPNTDTYSAYSIRGADCAIYMTFDIEPNQLDTFLQSTHVNSVETASGFQLSAIANNLRIYEGKTLNTDKDYLYGEYHGYPAQRIFFDVSNPNRYIAYVVTFYP